MEIDINVFTNLLSLYGNDHVTTRQYPEWESSIDATFSRRDNISSIHQPFPHPSMLFQRETLPTGSPLYIMVQVPLAYGAGKTHSFSHLIKCCAGDIKWTF